MLNEINFNNVCYLKNDAAHGCSSSLLTVSMSHSQLHIILESVSLAKYLGVDISSDLSWDTHINRISKKANNTLGFLGETSRITPNRLNILPTKFVFVLS